MSFLFSKATRLIQMLNPLIFYQPEVCEQHTEMGSIEQVSDGHGDIDNFEILDDHYSVEGPEHHTSDMAASTGFGREEAVQFWSVEDVISWLQSNVTLQSQRMEEFCRAFRSEGIDGLRLLALQKSNRACLGMTESEWLLLYGARETLLSRKVITPPDSHSSSPPFSSPRTPKQDITSPSSENSSRLHASKSMVVKPTHNSGFLRSSLRLLSFPTKQWWSSSSDKHEQKVATATEVFSLQEEILSAEEREASLKAKIDHLDEILRTAQLANYLFTRMRWTPLPGELPVDDEDVDDWLQRFLVLEGPTLFYFPRAADFRPEGAILFSEVVDVASISGRIQHDDDSLDWFGFQITTNQGLRFQCATHLKLQAELWLSSIQAVHAEQQSQRVETDCVQGIPD